MKFEIEQEYKDFTFSDIMDLTEFKRIEKTDFT